MHPATFDSLDDHLKWDIEINNYFFWLDLLHRLCLGHCPRKTLEEKYLPKYIAKLFFKIVYKLVACYAKRLQF